MSDNNNNNFEDYTDAYPKPENNTPPPLPEQENSIPVSEKLDSLQDNIPQQNIPRQQIPQQNYNYPYQQSYYPPPPPPNYGQPPYYGNYYQQQQQGMFYGDMYAPRYAPPPPKPKCPPPPPAKPIVMNKKILFMAFVMAVMIFLLCIYCIIADLMHGALNSEPIQNTVVLQMQEKPELNPEDENVTVDGEYTVKGVAELVKPSIIEVYVYKISETGKSLLSGTGSGIIISEDGYIITNAHVVQGDSYKIAMDDESEFDAVLIGSDNKTDLAVLKINAKNLNPAVLGNSDEVYVGENVIAIGNPAGLANTVTKGIVSAINRQVRADSNGFMMDCIQTDAAISPGNSGGALVNMYGQVIGITSSKYASGYASGYEATYEGLGFAITINQALPVVQDLIENGYVSGRFRIGIVFMASNTEYASMQFQEMFGTEMPKKLENSLWVSEISEDCDIANTELQPNDFILSMNGESVSDYDDVLAVLDGCKGGDTVTAECARFEKGKIAYYDIAFKLEEDTSGNY
ncbi:MAG: trypsin-like peptidase domain-containing protein [Oscillospiraceae bacterium]|nr:trypsin-like peptidase domain-containing protein [Oscillospiraceae bacterium]